MKKIKKSKKNYKFTDKQHSVEGMIATALACIALILFITGIIIAFQYKGNANVSVGILGFLSFVLSVIGFLVGLHSYKREDVFFVYSYIGVISNTIIWFAMLCVILVGI